MTTASGYISYRGKMYRCRPSFDYLSGSRQMMVFMYLVVVWIGQFCGDVIGHQNVKVVISPVSVGKWRTQTSSVSSP